MGTRTNAVARLLTALAGAAVAVAAVIAVAAVLLSGCAASSSTAAHGPATARVLAHPAAARPVVHTVRPYRADGTLVATPARTLSGSCFTQTVAAGPSTGAYRCIAGTAALLDPCLPPPGVAHPTTLACLGDPWSAPTLLRLTAALPAPAPATGSVARPWALQLADGTRCTATAGTTTRSRGVDLVYACTGGAGASSPRADSAGVLRTDTVSRAGVVARRVAVRALWQI